ncbi:MAG: DUF4292 domain-containing protein [Bacteroidaceae bacterium]|nr:DUF4292 domain-containing protein [Bacteroidaceae bacterium]
MKHTLSRALLLMALVALTATGCKSTKNVMTTHSGPTPGIDGPKASYAKKVLSNAIESRVLTAKMKVNLAMGDKNISLSGSLRMKRGDVIQLSMTFPLVGEVCRMEFTNTDVLIVDRINSRYVRTDYDKIDFLRSANLDFSALESIFWNEIFYPGSNSAQEHLGEYTISSAGSHTLLSLTTAPKLDYAFLTITESALLDRVTISSKNVTDTSNLVCSYGDFAKFSSGRFPTHMQLNFAGDKQNYGLDISLSSLATNSDWQTRTQLSSKYTPMDADRLFRSIIP